MLEHKVINLLTLNQYDCKFFGMVRHTITKTSSEWPLFMAELHNKRSTLIATAATLGAMKSPSASAAGKHIQSLREKRRGGQGRPYFGGALTKPLSQAIN
jgi:hypothetical protein